MKKFLSLAIVAAFLTAGIGCDDKKTSEKVKVPSSSSVPVPSSSAK